MSSMTSTRPDAPSPQPLSRERERSCDPGAFLLHADWNAPTNVHAFTTLRSGAGNSQAPFDSFNLGNARAVDGDDPGVVARNRAELFDRAGLPSPPRWLRQVHGTRVVRFDAPSPAKAGEGWGGVPSAAPRTVGTPSQPPPAFAGGGVEPAAAAGDVEPEADAAVTSATGVVLAILTADCLPVVFAARDGSEVGAAHAGWRGLAAGVLEETVAAMRTAPTGLVAWLGPAAGPEAYEIGEEVFDAFVARDPRAEAAFTATRPGHWRIDLYALARQRLADAGVTAVHGGGLCTISDPQRFFSHRRDGRSGRIATLAWMT
jgi:YfiH family protein